jgi:hypothetical protein
MVIVGLIEMVVTPMILRRLFAKNPFPRFDYVIRTTRLSGLLVVILGLYFILGGFR